MVSNHKPAKKSAVISKKLKKGITESDIDIKKRSSFIYEELEKEYPDVKCGLFFTSPFQLLVATILSAQCTDQRVNEVGKTLFKKYKTPQDFADIPQEELEKEIYSTGFFRQKAKSIKNCSIELIQKYKGKVPKDFDELNSLSGVGRKTASVVAGNAFGIPSVAVDTHVKRLSNLLGLIKSESPEEIETRIKEILPEERWINFSHLLITHGRNICIARRPRCGRCVIGYLCPSFNPKLE